MPPSKFVLPCSVSHIEQLGDRIYRLRMSSPKISALAKSGQFVNIRVSDHFNPLWRRPFSIHRVNTEEGWFEIYFGVVGRSSKVLAEKKTGDVLDVLGPLGGHFIVPKDLRRALLVAGGLGIAPLLLLAEELKLRQIETILFYGAKSQSSLCAVEDFRALGVKCVLTTDDGSAGSEGIVTDELRAFLISRAGPEIQLFSCGSMPMLVEVQKIAHEFGISGQVSIETLMACGFGICMGCPVESSDSSVGRVKYFLTCKDGPVFPIDRIKLNSSAQLHP